MAIGLAVQNGPFITICNEDGKPTARIAAHDGLVGYTLTRVAIRNGDRIGLYGENGKQLASVLSPEPRMKQQLRRGKCAA